MPWKERYTISDEKSIVDTDIKWPDGKRCCFRVVVDLSPQCGPEGIKPDDLTTAGAAEAWMRQVQTSPADFLKLKFAIQAASGPPATGAPR